MKNFTFSDNAGYQWFIDRNLVGFEPFTQLQPWFFTLEKDSFCATQKWPNIFNEELFVFARRQDNDDLACFSVKNEEIVGVVVIQGWVGNGFVVLKKFENFWEWIKFVIDDIAEWSSLDGE